MTFARAIKPVSQPWSEIDRLAALRSYGVLDTPREAAFDEITQVASLVCKAPIALVSFVEDTRQFFKSEVGFGVRETSLDVSICAHAILQRDLFVVPDTTQDERFASTPLVKGEPYVRFYAGALLTTPEDLPAHRNPLRSRHPVTSRGLERGTSRDVAGAGPRRDGAA
jgi:GAF domain-containing protein